MGALAASALKWIPEDDLLLKNAVEAGASLESLAKGAVRFSCWFTFKELQDRWRALLYDPHTPTEVSARIVELESELTVPNPSKTIRPVAINAKDCLSGKRKGDSLRSHYYSMRKRVCSDPHSHDLAYTMQVNPLHVDHDDACGQHLQYQTNYADISCAPFPPLLCHYKNLVMGCNRQHNVQLGRLRTSDANCNFTEQPFLVGYAENELPNDLMNQDSLYGDAHNIIPSTDKTGENNMNQHFEHDYAQIHVSPVLGNDILPPNSCPNAHGIGSPHASKEVNGEAITIGDIDSANDNYENHCPEYVRNDNSSLQVSRCTTSSHQFDYPSSAAEEGRK